MGLKAVIVVPAVSTGTYTTSPVNVLPASGITIVCVNGSAATTVNLPASPVPNQIVVVQDAGYNAATYHITVQGNGNNIIIPQVGSVTSYVIGASGSDSWFNWNGSSWGILA